MFFSFLFEIKPLAAVTAFELFSPFVGVQEIVDHLEVQRLAWKREERSKNEAAQEATPGTIPDQEPDGGTADVVLSQEEGGTYEPPENPPPP